jgi:hypothetical protein
VNLSDRLDKLEARLTPDCDGPVITLEFGTPAAPAARFCPLCGRPLAEHEGPFGIVFVDVPGSWYEGGRP